LKVWDLGFRVLRLRVEGFEFGVKVERV